MACLHPLSPSSSSESEAENDEECMVEVGSYTVSQSTLLKVFSSLKTEELVMKSSKGPMISLLTDEFLAHINSAEVVCFCDSIVKQLQLCLETNKNGKIAMSSIWRRFHLLRLSTATRKQWQSCVHALHVSKDILTVCEMALQLVLKRTMESVVQQITASRQPNSLAQVQTDLSIRELNVIRYIAGCIVLKMKKKYPLHSSFFNDAVVCTYNCSGVGSIEDYSRIWVEQVDRGGLYHVSDGFFILLKQVESICRQYLDIRSTPTESLVTKIKENILGCPVVSGLWQDIVSGSPDDQHMCACILQSIVDLWINIRVHSFSKKWSDSLQANATVACHSKALRKTLKLKGTDKDSS